MPLDSRQMELDALEKAVSNADDPEEETMEMCTCPKCKYTGPEREFKASKTPSKPETDMTDVED